MKKLLLSVVALLSVSILSAQEIKFGAKAGLNLSTAKFEIPPIVIGGIEAAGEKQDNKFTTGFHVGGFVEIGITDKFSFQPELLFSAQGAKFVSNDVERQNIQGIEVVITSNTETILKNNYFNVPLLGKFYATEKLFFAAGPQLGFLLSAKSKSSGSSTTSATFAGNTQTMVSNVDPNEIDVKDNFKGFNLSLGLGGGYFFTENIFAEARYNLGLTNDSKPEEIDALFDKIKIEPIFKASSIQFSLGYRF